MKKKILSLLLIFIFILGCCLSACDNKPNSEPNDVELKNADLLALSYDRLENANLSFDFSIEASAEESAVSTSQSSNATEFDASPVSDAQKIYEVKPDDLIPIDSLQVSGIFEFCKVDTQNMSQEAHSMVDYAVDHITVMDTCVESSSGWKMVLKYDNQNDVVTVFKQSDMQKSTIVENKSNYIVNVYYDEDGDETVEMWAYHYNWNKSGQEGIIDIKTGYTKHIIYTPDKYYNYSNYTWEYDKQGINKTAGTYQEAIAYKEDGEWRCITQVFDREHPLFTDGGVYDLLNGRIYITFLVEKDGIMYKFEKTINPYRDGNMIMGIEASVLPDDEYRIDDMNIGRAGIGIDYSLNRVDVQLSLLNGWEKVDIPSNSFESIILSNGDELQLKYNAIWVPEYGWYNYFGLIELDKDYDNVIRLLHSYGTGTTEDKIVGYTLGIEFSDVANKFLMPLDQKIGEEQRKVLVDFLKEYGLGFVDSTYEEILSDLFFVNENIDDYADSIYDNIYGCQLTVEKFKETTEEIINQLDAFENGFDHMLDGYEKINFDDLPKKPANIGLISISNNMVGEIAITSEGLDFSELQLNVSKSTILSSNNQYRVFVGWSSGGGTAYLNAFDTQSYTQQTMQFLGNSNVPLPKITREGEYTLIAYFGKQTVDGQRIRLSEIVTKIPVKSFETLETRVDVEGGYYINQIYLFEGFAKLKVTFVDTSEE